jgi:hypothetical protein
MRKTTGFWSGIVLPERPLVKFLLAFEAVFNLVFYSMVRVFKNNGFVLGKVCYNY